MTLLETRPSLTLRVPLKFILQTHFHHWRVSAPLMASSVALRNRDRKRHIRYGHGIRYAASSACHPILKMPLQRRPPELSGGVAHCRPSGLFAAWGGYRPSAEIDRRRRALEKISPDNNKSGIENAKYFATRKTAVRSVPFDSMKRAYDIDKRCKLILESRIRVLKFESRSLSG
jgi:hypothetical protein